MLLLEERHLKWQDAKESIDVAFYVFYAMFLPCPYLR